MPTINVSLKSVYQIQKDSIGNPVLVSEDKHEIPVEIVADMLARLVGKQRSEKHNEFMEGCR